MNGPNDPYLCGTDCTGMDEVYVVDVSTTGGFGFPRDAVFQVAVCRVERGKEDFETVLSRNVGMDPMDVGKDSLDYMTEAYGLGADVLYAGDPLIEVVGNVRECLRGKECTAFDVGTVFGRFLCVEPWDLNGTMSILPAVSLRLPKELRGSPSNAYSAMYPDDRFCIGDGREATDRASMTSAVLIRLMELGLYRSVTVEHDGPAGQFHQGADYVHDGVKDGQRDYHQHLERTHDYSPTGQDQDHDGREYQKADEEEHVAGGTGMVAVYLPEPEETKEPRDHGKEEPYVGCRLLPLLPAPGRTALPAGFLDRGLRRDLLVAFWTGYGIGRDQHPTERTVTVGHLVTSV